MRGQDGYNEGGKPEIETGNEARKRLRDLGVAEWLDGRRSLDDLQLSR